MTVKQSNLSHVDLKCFGNESNRTCMLQVQRSDKMIAEKLKLSKADHSNLWTCFRFQALFHHEKHLHFHQNIGVYNLTRRNKRKKAINITKNFI